MAASEDRSRDEALVLALRAGDEDAFGLLYDRWFDRVHDLALRITHDEALAGDVAQDAFLSAWQRLPSLEDPASFGGWLLRIARNRALDLVRSPARARTESVGDVTETRAADRLVGGDDPADLAADGEVQDLVWGAAAALNERDLTALSLHLRMGLEPAEIGEVLGINRNAANQLVHRMRARLEAAVRSRVLWRGGRAECPDLRDALAAEGLDEFDARAVRAVETHAQACARCSERRDRALDPVRLFAAMPIAVAPVLLKAKAAAAMEAAGIPMTGSVHAGGGPGRRRPPRRRLLAGAAAAVAVVSILAVAERIDEDPEAVPMVEAAEELAPPSTTTTVVPGTIVVSVVPDEAPAAPDAPDPGEQPAAPAPGPTPDPGAPTPPPPPPPPPAAPIGSISVAPSTRPQTTLVADEAVVSWSSAGGTSVTVSGPGLSSSAASGSQAVCPGTAGSATCVTPPGSYTYTLTVTGPGGTIHRSTILTVT